MAILNDDEKKDVIQQYLDSDPTADNSPEIVKQLAEDFNVTSNGIRMLLQNAGVYVKKEAVTSANKESASTTGTKRVSKDAAIKDLKAAITAKGKEIDDSVLDKLTGKAAVYLLSVIN